MTMGYSNVCSNSMETLLIRAGLASASTSSPIMKEWEISIPAHLSARICVVILTSVISTHVAFQVMGNASSITQVLTSTCLIPALKVYDALMLSCPVCAHNSIANLSRLGGTSTHTRCTPRAML